MSYVGLITRKDKPTGIKLKAKVVTPNKQKYIEKIFDVKIKENAINDITSCVLDHGTVVSNIMSSQTMLNLTSDLALIYIGDNGASISYEIEDTTAPYLSNYLRSDGKLLGKPKYGEEDTKGFLKITVTKGEEKIQSSIEVCIKAYTAQEVLNDEAFNEEKFWNEIMVYGTANKSYQQNNNIVEYELNLPSKKTVPEKSIIDVDITWEVVDKTLNVAENTFYDEPRLYYLNNKAKINKCSYVDACTMIGDDTNPFKQAGVTATAKGKTGDATQNRVLIDGIELKMILSIQKENDEVETSERMWKCSTYSENISNAEIEQIVLKNLFVEMINPTTELSESVLIEKDFDNITKIHNIIATTDTTTYLIRAYSNNGTKYFNSDALNIAQGDLVGIALDYSFRNFENTTSHINYPAAFSEHVDDMYSDTTVNLELFKSLSGEQKKFTLLIKYTIKGYSGAEITNELYAQFEVDTTALTASSGNSSQSPSGSGS